MDESNEESARRNMGHTSKFAKYHGEEKINLTLPKHIQDFIKPTKKKELTGGDLLLAQAEARVYTKSEKYQGEIKYKGELIAQWHNPKLFIDDILGENETKQFTSIMIVGTPGTGKSTLATFIAHNLHEKNTNYYVQHFGREELLKFDIIIKQLPSKRDVILIFDDVSLVFKNIKDPAKRTKILTTLTEARHPTLEASDRRVIVITNVHYKNSMEKMWRSQGSWMFYTDMSGEEADVFNHSTKGRFKHKVELFTGVTLQQFRRKKFNVSLTNRRMREYAINKPFRFIMCYDNFKLRFFLVPEEFCNFCSKDSHKLKRTDATPDEIIALAEKYYEKDGIAGLKQALLLSGHTEQYRNHVVYGFNTCKEILSTFNVDVEALAIKLRQRAKITDKRLYTIRKKKLDFIGDLKEIRGKVVLPLDITKQTDTDLEL